VTKVAPRLPESYKLRDFAKWAKKAGISDRDLFVAVVEMDKGLLGDRLGDHVYKKRIGVDGRGKRGGARMVVLFRAGDVVLFLHGYLKKESDDMSDNEQEQVRLFARQFLLLTAADREQLRAKGKLIPLES
jgi:hypothetical protein